MFNQRVLVWIKSLLRNCSLAGPGTRKLCGARASSEADELLVLNAAIRCPVRGQLARGPNAQLCYGALDVVTGASRSPEKNKISASTCEPTA